MPVSSTQNRHPRLRALVNGIPLAAPISADVVSNNHYAADRFCLVARVTSAEMADWSQATQSLVRIQLSLDAAVWTDMIHGEVDQIQIDPISHQLRIEGRDLTSRLIEARTQETFSNQTSSEIAASLAQRHGLDTDIETTTTPAGVYWQLEHDQISLDSFGRSTSEWDLLVALAGHEGFDVWISDTTLHFRSTQQSQEAVATLRPVATTAGPANVTYLKMDRALTLARDIEVVVKSWNSRQANAFVQTARVRRENGPAPTSQPRRYVYVVPNLTPDAALRLSQVRLAELTRHERVIHVDMPGELTLMPRQQVILEGTGTEFDQAYWIDEIVRHISFDRGFSQHLRARNETVGSQATSPADPVGVGTGGEPWSGF